jgi:hypothetical protein
MSDLLGGLARLFVAWGIVIALSFFFDWLGGPCA